MSAGRVVQDPNKGHGPLDFVTDCLKSNFTLMHVFSERRKAPPFSFSLFLVMWSVWWGVTMQKIPQSMLQNWILPEGLVTSGVLTQAQGSTEEKLDSFLPPLLLHWVVPASGFLRTCLVGSHLILLGYVYESSSIGTTQYMMRFLGSHGALVVLTAFLGLGQMTGPASSPVIIGFESTLCFMQCCLALDNPIVSNHAVSDEWLRIKTSVLEPRWHGWILLMLLLLTGPQPWNLTLGRYALGLVLGTLFVLRHPSVWPKMMDLVKRQKQFLFTLGLWTLALLRWPVTSADFTLLHFLLAPHHWLKSSPNSYLNLSLFIEPLPEALFLLSFGLAFIPLSILLLGIDPEKFWFVKPIYGGLSAILAMTIMNSRSWAYVEPGFLVLIWSVYGFFIC